MQPDHIKDIKELDFTPGNGKPNVILRCSLIVLSSSYESFNCLIRTFQGGLFNNASLPPPTPKK